MTAMLSWCSSADMMLASPKTGVARGPRRITALVMPRGFLGMNGLTGPLLLGTTRFLNFRSSKIEDMSRLATALLSSTGVSSPGSLGRLFFASWGSLSEFCCVESSSTSSSTVALLAGCGRSSLRGREPARFLLPFSRKARLSKKLPAVVGSCVGAMVMVCGGRGRMRY